MNMMTSVERTPPVPPIAILRALPPGPMAAKYEKLKRFAELFAAFERDDMELAVDLLIAEMDARAPDPDLEETGDLEVDPLAGGEITTAEWPGSRGVLGGYDPEHGKSSSQPHVERARSRLSLRWAS